MDTENQQPAETEQTSAFKRHLIAVILVVLLIVGSASLYAHLKYAREIEADQRQVNAAIDSIQGAGGKAINYEQAIEPAAEFLAEAEKKIEKERDIVALKAENVAIDAANYEQVIAEPQVEGRLRRIRFWRSVRGLFRPHVILVVVAVMAAVAVIVTFGYLHAGTIMGKYDDVVKRFKGGAGGPNPTGQQEPKTEV